MNKLFIIACSHGMGCEIEGAGIGHFTKTNLENCYGSIVAKKLNLKPLICLGLEVAMIEYIEQFIVYLTTVLNFSKIHIKQNQKINF